jgi:hypothetical protein
MTEAEYQAKLIKKLNRRFPGCLIFRGDPYRNQGILDWLILYEERWASLEVKASRSAPVRPNQDYFVARLNGMSFAAYIYPENEKEVLDALEQALKPPRRARVSQS